MKKIKEVGIFRFLSDEYLYFLALEFYQRSLAHPITKSEAANCQSLPHQTPFTNHHMVSREVRDKGVLQLCG